MKRNLAIAGLAVCSLIGVASADVITVTSNPLWTDTGISLNGETVGITATGSWTWGFGAWVGPEGDPTVPSKWIDDEWVRNGRHAQLIAFVGADPYMGTVDVDYYAVGSSGTLSGLTGDLWLGFNDARLSQTAGGTDDNYGTVEATINVVPEPSVGAALSLCGLATGLGCLLRQKMRGACRPD